MKGVELKREGKGKEGGWGKGREKSKLMARCEISSFHRRRVSRPTHQTPYIRIQIPPLLHLAYLAVHSLLTRIASCSFSFQCAATSFARGSSCRSESQRSIVELRRRVRVLAYRVRCAQQRLDREKDGTDLESWRPLVLEDVEADTA